MKTLEERIAEKISVNSKTQCHEWLGSTTKKGYGMIWVDNGMKLVHRVRYEMTYGPIDQGNVIRHKCDNPKCSNPEHLIIGTHAENMKDMVVRNRQATGIKNGRAKITPEIVKQIINSNKSQTEIAKEFGISQSQVGRIKRGVHWK